MPLTPDGFRPYTKDEIKERLVQNFEQLFDETVEPGDLVDKQLEAEAETRANNQEQALQEVYRSAYIDSATDDELDRLVARIGLSRNTATPATGVVEFRRESVPDATYTVPSGSTVQTAGSDPIKFDTTTVATLHLADSFEDDDLTEWEGDTSSYSTTTHSELDSIGLEIPATNNVGIHRLNPSIKIGSTIQFPIYPQSGTRKSVIFARHDANNYYEAIFDVGADDLVIRIVEEGSVVDSATANVTLPASETSYVLVEHGLNQLSLTVQDRNRDARGVVSLAESERRFTEGTIGFESYDGDGAVYVEKVGTAVATADIEGQSGGVDGNVGPDTITTSPQILTGVETITNPLPTGDTNYDDTTGTAFVLGQERESDEELRQRAFDSTSIGGAATADAIGSEIRALEEVQSMRIFQNKTDTDNTDSGGLPPHSFEVAVYGGIDADIAETIFETKSIDSRDVGGVHGTEKTHTITSDVLNDDVTIHWTEVPEVTLNLTLDCIVDDTYVGDEEIQSRVVDYIGGTDIDGAIVEGTGVGEDVYESMIKDQIVSPSETGVWEVDSITIDADGDGTDDTTTLASGADVLQIADSEIAVTNARDGSITVNTTDK